MPNFNFDILRAAGVEAPPGHYIGKGAGISVIKTQLFRPGIIQFDKADKSSFLGTPVFSNLELKSGEFVPLGETASKTFDGLRIDTVLFTVSQQKTVIQTPIVGRPGTIKEYIADGDFSITCEGIIIGETTEGTPQKETGGAGGDSADRSTILNKKSIGNKYPDRDVNRFIKLMEVPEPLKFSSSFLERFGTFDLVVTDYDLTQTRGASNYQVFTLQMLSDTPIELQ